MEKIRLGVNIDHVATVRNARGENYPDPVRAAILAQKYGADGITAHLREDRRHISDDDVFRLKRDISLPLNMEMAATEEMLEIALKAVPHATCIVPERRQEVTTEGGLDVAGNRSKLKGLIKELKAKNIRVSLFIDAQPQQLEAAKELQADIVELHTGAYAHAQDNSIAKKDELVKIQQGAGIARKLGLECHAGHGLTYDNVKDIAKIENIVELNIGHFLISEAIFLGLEESIKQMRKLIDSARV